MKAWYFSSKNKRLANGDNRLIKAGVIHTVDGKPILCKHGLHGSQNILDALQYAKSSHIWRVDITGDLDGNGKLAGQSRHYYWGYDATEVLRKFARLCALDVAHLWDVPDVVVKFLSGDESVREDAYLTACYAKSTAQSAIESVIYATDYDIAPCRAAHCAAEYAADAAASYAVDYMTDSCTHDKMYFAARENQEKRLYKMIMAERPKS